MALILCPECGTKISNKAISCPYCGFVSEDRTRAISEQDTYEVLPIFEYDIVEWNPDKSNLSPIAFEDNKTLVNLFGKWENIQLKLPAIAQIIMDMASKEGVLVAKIDPYIKKLIDTGVYRFTVDENGEILPTIRDAKNIVKQVRLEEMNLTPEFANSMNNISTHVAMSQILDEIKYVGEALRGIHIELQNDRIALAESSKDKLLSAYKIQDKKLREIAVLNAISTATEAKRILMRNFSENTNYLLENYDKNTLMILISPKNDNKQKANESLQALVSITNLVQIECQGYAMLGEYQASQECLCQFNSFISNNKLDNRDTLLQINEFTPTHNLPLVDEFMVISDKISKFDTISKLDFSQNIVLEDG